jgi:hypothetical protein
LLSVSCGAAAAAPGPPAADPGSANPEDGSVVDGVYTNPYFALRYPLPAGWKEGLQPPRPSYTGYYVLTTPAPPEDARATILVAAQDAFFVAEPANGAVALAEDLARRTSEDDRTTTEPSMVTIAGRSFARIAIRRSPLSQIVLATDIRCHVLVFTFTGAEFERLEQLSASLNELSLAADASGGTAVGAPFPACAKGYATPETILRRVEPVAVGPQFLKIPVRVIIGTEGSVRHIHVIRAFPEQRKSIEEALAQWQLKPYLANGQSAQIETGLVFELKPMEKQK